MKNYGYRKCCIILIAAITGSLLLLPGCTPESPPLDPNTHSEVSGASSSDNSNATVKEKSQASAADPSSVSEKSSDKTESSMLSSEPEKSDDGTENSTISTESENNDKRTENGSVQSNVPANDSTLSSISDEIKGKIVEMTFRYTDETPETYYCTDDNDMLAKLTNALNGITTGKELSSPASGNGVIIFFTGKGSSGRLDFRDGCRVKNGKAYETNGYDALDSVLKEIKEKYPEWKKKYEDWIHKMSEAENRIQELTTSDEYLNTDIEGKRSMLTKLLNTLTDEELIKKGSICDSGDTISYVYNCSDEGISGAVMLTGFDPMMN